MSYSSDELKSAVSEIVQGTVAFKRDVLGPRDAGTPFDEIRELVNSTLLYEPDSIYYIIYLASQSLQKIVTDEVEIIDELLDAVDDLLKPDKPVANVRSLLEASNALGSLESAIGRSGRVGSAEYNRYTRAIERSKTAFGNVTKYTYTPRGSSQSVTDIVRPAARAKKDATAYFTSLKEQHTELLTRVNNILSAFDAFGLDELATLVAKTQVTKAKSQLTTLHSQLDTLSPSERTSYARDALLKVLANKSVVGSMTNAPEPGGVKLVQGKGAAATYRLSATGSGTPPYIEGTASAPYRLKSGAQESLSIELNDEGSDLVLSLLPSGDSFVAGIESATLTGSRSGPFQIFDDLESPRIIHSKDVTTQFGLSAGADRLHMIVDGVSYEVTLPTGAGSTVAGVVSAIIGSSLSTVVTASEVAGAVSGTRLQLEYTPPTKPLRYRERHMHIVEGADNAVMGPYLVGGVQSPHGSTAGYAVYNFGWDDNTELKVKADDGLSEETIDLTVGTWTGSPDTSYSRTAEQVRDDINAQASRFTASVDEDRVVLTSASEGEGSIVTIVTDGQYGAGLPASDPKEGTGTPSFNGAVTIGFYEGQEDRKRDIDGRVVVNILNEDVTFSANATAKMVRTEQLRSRRVTKHSSFDDGISFSGDSDLTSDWPSDAELKVQILNGDNRGVYGISSKSYSAGVHTIRLDRDLRDGDTSLLHEIVVYKEVIRITSLDNTTNGLLHVKSVANSAHTVLGLALTASYSTVGKVYIEYNDPRLGWVPADLRQRLLKVDDQVTKLSDNASVTNINSISEASSGLLTVSPEVSPSLSLDTTDGFDVKSRASLDYSDFKGLLDTWKDNLEPYDDVDLSYVDKTLSPILLVNATVPRVNAAYDAIDTLRDKLTGSGSLIELLQGFSVASVFQVDQALQTLLEQGHNRARKLLLKADIAGYLATTKEDSSYGKAMMKATSQIAVKDVNEPTNLTRHLSEDRERVTAEWFDDKDPLNDFSDIEDDLVDPDALEFWEGVD